VNKVQPNINLPL